MPLSINTNIASMTAQRAMLNSNAALETSFERLSTGKRVNSAVDAAGLAIGKDLESRVRGLNRRSGMVTMASRWSRSQRVAWMKSLPYFSACVTWRFRLLTTR